MSREIALYFSHLKQILKTTISFIIGPTEFHMEKKQFYEVADKDFQNLSSTQYLT